MVRLDRGGTWINVRIRAGVLFCVFAISLLLPTVSHALSIDPVLERAVSVVTLNETENTTNRDIRRGSSRAEDKAPASTSPSSEKSTSATMQSVTAPSVASQQAIIIEPLAQLPSIDATDTIQQDTTHMYQPVSSSTARHAILGAAATDSVMPLQTSTHGWKILDVAWYWWMIAVSLGYFSVRQLARFRRDIGRI